MTTLDEKFKALAAENAPGQEVRRTEGELHTFMQGEKLAGSPVDFSHGDVDAFPPTPASEEIWQKGFQRGGAQAYTEYRGSAKIRQGLAVKLSAFTASSISAEQELIITPGTQGALFMALGASIEAGSKVAVVEPDYFANRKLVNYFGAILVPIPLAYDEDASTRGPDLDALERAFKDGTKTLVFSTPNNPTGLVYSQQTIEKIAALASQYDVTVIVDQLYSRLLYQGESYTHLCACQNAPENIITIMGPSKTESLSGFRLGVAFGNAKFIERMERLQAIVSLRAAGYNQTVLEQWFDEPTGWMDARIRAHEAIRDDVLAVFRSAGMPTATPQAGSYVFPLLPPLTVSVALFVRLLRYQAGVTVTPGAEFGPTTVDCIRLNFSQDHLKAVAAVKRIVKMVEIYKKMIQPVAQGNYLPATRHNDLIYTSGMTPRENGKLRYSGKIDASHAVEFYAPAVQLATQNALTAAQALVEKGEKIIRIIQLTVYLNTTEEFTQHPKIADFASDYLLSEIGQGGIGSRAAVGVQTLPSDAMLEITLISAVAHISSTRRKG